MRGATFKEGARRGFLKDGELLLDMLEDRKTAHIYDEKTSKEIFDRISGQYLDSLNKNIKLFEKYLSAK